MSERLESACSSDIFIQKKSSRDWRTRRRVPRACPRRSSTSLRSNTPLQIGHSSFKYQKRARGIAKRPQSNEPSRPLCERSHAAPSFPAAPHHATHSHLLFTLVVAHTLASRGARPSRYEAVVTVASFFLLRGGADELVSRAAQVGARRHEPLRRPPRPRPSDATPASAPPTATVAGLPMPCIEE